MGLWDRPECPLSPRSTLGGGCPRHPGRASFEPAQQKAYAEASRTLGVLVLVSVSPRRTGNVEVGPRAAAHELLKKERGRDRSASDLAVARHVRQVGDRR